MVLLGQNTGIINTKQSLTTSKPAITAKVVAQAMLTACPCEPRPSNRYRNPKNPKRYFLIESQHRG
jgi:hypothetical protein